MFSRKILDFLLILFLLTTIMSVNASKPLSNKQILPTESKHITYEDINMKVGEKHLFWYDIPPCPNCPDYPSKHIEYDTNYFKDITPEDNHNPTHNTPHYLKALKPGTTQITITTHGFYTHTKIYNIQIN